MPPHQSHATAPPDTTGAGTRVPAPRAPRRWWADVAGSAAMLGIVVVVVLWLAGGGLRQLTGAGAVATTTGRLTGLVASDLLLLQVLLVARIPWVERSYGQDTLVRRHRLAGFVSFWLMLVHIGLITVGYAQQARTGVLAEAWRVVLTYPGMLLATAGAALLVAVVVLSVRAARRAVRYESWHLLHLYAYLGVGLALPHQLWTGQDFVSSPVARAYWWTLYGATLAAVAVFRVGLPLWRSAYHRLEVAAVVPEAPGVVSVYLRGHRLDRLPVRAGQFFLWRFLDGPGWSRAHPYTVSAAPDAGGLRITVKDLGDGSARAATLRPGTRVLIEGPYGAMTAARQRRPKVLLMAAGVGITTMRALLEDLSGDVTLLYRVSHLGDAVFAAELDELARRRGARVLYLDGPRASRDSWLPQRFAHVTDPAGLRWLVPDVAEHEVYLCGPPQWMDAARVAAQDAGVPAEHIHFEAFAW